MMKPPTTPRCADTGGARGAQEADAQETHALQAELQGLEEQEQYERGTSEGGWRRRCTRRATWGRRPCTFCRPERWRRRPPLPAGVCLACGAVRTPPPPPSSTLRRRTSSTRVRPDHPKTRKWQQDLFFLINAPAVQHQAAAGGAEEGRRRRRVVHLGMSSSRRPSPMRRRIRRSGGCATWRTAPPRAPRAAAPLLAAQPRQRRRRRRRRRAVHAANVCGDGALHAERRRVAPTAEAPTSGTPTTGWRRSSRCPPAAGGVVDEKMGDALDCPVDLHRARGRRAAAAAARWTRRRARHSTGCRIRSRRAAPPATASRARSTSTRRGHRRAGQLRGRSRQGRSAPASRRRRRARRTTPCSPPR